ncbi:MAG: transposase [Hyphomicrobiaceae bacterium]|jgi:transposase
MAGFVEETDREQMTLFPARLEDYVGEDNPVRAVDVFVDNLDLDRLGFVRVQPLNLGRPGYDPRTMLKLYIYGYLNRVPSSRRLERECHRNIEVIWLTGQLAPDFKTIADFRKDNGKAIREVCRAFVALCRKLDLLSSASVAIDGSKFKAVNARDKNFTEAKMKRRLEKIDKNIARYLSQLETADRHGDAVPAAKVERLKSKIEKLKEEIVRLNGINDQMVSSQDRQISLTDPDARSMATSGKDTGIVGYNVQAAVDTEHHLIVAHEVTNIGTDRHQLADMAELAREELGSETLDVVADRGYYEGGNIKACEDADITVTLPKPQTSGAKAEGRFGKQDFVYVSGDDVYRCPAGERLTYRYQSLEKGKTIRRYWTNVCKDCALKAECTTGPERRISRWEHEALLEKVQSRLDHNPDAMRVRRSTAEHPFGTIKCWMGATHFLTMTLPKVATEMALNVLAYNMKRVIAIMGVSALLEAMAG